MGYVCGGVCVHWEEGQIISYLTRKIEICQQALSPTSRQYPPSTTQHWTDRGGCRWATPFAGGDGCTHPKPDQHSCQQRPSRATTSGRSQQPYWPTGAGRPILQGHIYHLAACWWWRQTSARETSLNGTDRLHVLHSLPAKFDTILPRDLAVPMAQLWNVSLSSNTFIV